MFPLVWRRKNRIRVAPEGLGCRAQSGPATCYSGDHRMTGSGPAHMSYTNSVRHTPSTEALKPLVPRPRANRRRSDASTPDKLCDGARTTALGIPSAIHKAKAFFPRAYDHHEKNPMTQLACRAEKIRP